MLNKQNGPCFNKHFSTNGMVIFDEQNGRFPILFATPFRQIVNSASTFR